MLKVAILCLGLKFETTLKPLQIRDFAPKACPRMSVTLRDTCVFVDKLRKRVTKGKRARFLIFLLQFVPLPLLPVCF